MRTRSLVIFAILISALVLALAVVALAEDPHIGTWKLNLAKSKYSPASSAPKSATMIFTAQDNGVKCVSEGVESNGKAYHEEFAPKYDGKDYPYTGSSEVDTIAYTKIDANTLDWVIQKAGKIVGSGQSVISRDGKTRTVTAKGKDAKGQDTTRTSVFEKQ
jgi:hypothetical protein